MSKHEVFIFGSFTEDETRSFWRQSVKNGVPSTEKNKTRSVQRSSVESDLPPMEKTGFLVGSLDFASVSSPDSSGVKHKISGSSVSSEDVQTLKPNTEDSPCKNGAVAVSNTKQGVLGTQLNGGVSGFCLFNDGVAENENNTLNLSSMHITENATGKDVLKSLKLRDDEDEKSRSEVMAFVENDGKTSSNQASMVKCMLPRGLINSGNLCFLNATLQALLSCSPFINLLQDLQMHNIPKTGYPTLRAFVEFISDFHILDNSSSKKNERAVLQTGKPFNPIMFEPVLKNFTPDLPTSLLGRPRQEDAQEFLSFVMDQMHDELLKFQGHSLNLNGGRSSFISSAEDDGWETVGPKNKSAVTRTQCFMPSELSAIFGGQLKSVVKARGNKASATVQPFLLLHLDIFPESVHTLEDAFHLFSASEILEEYRISAGKAGVVTASKSVKIQMLSKVMILHLMRFSYGSKGSTKLHKPVRFPLELVLGRDLLVSPSSEGRKYELVATITHHGREPWKGHYTADTRYSDGQWLRYDDASVTAVGTSAVLHDQAYLLFYKQM